MLGLFDTWVCLFLGANQQGWSPFGFPSQPEKCAPSTKDTPTSGAVALLPLSRQGTSTKRLCIEQMIWPRHAQRGPRSTNFNSVLCEGHAGLPGCDADHRHGWLCPRSGDMRFALTNRIARGGSPFVNSELLACNRTGPQVFWLRSMPA